MNFIITLLITTDDYNYLLIITDKFSKRVLIILRQTIYDTAEWADFLLTALIKNS